MTGNALNEGKCRPKLTQLQRSHRNSQKKKGATETANKTHVIHESVWTARGKYGLGGMLAEVGGDISPDRHWTTATQQQGPCFLWLLRSLLRSPHLKRFGIDLTASFSNESLAQQLSAHRYVSWLLDNGWGITSSDRWPLTMVSRYTGRFQEYAIAS